MRVHAARRVALGDVDCLVLEEAGRLLGDQLDLQIAAEHLRPEAVRALFVGAGVDGEDLLLARTEAFDRLEGDAAVVHLALAPFDVVRVNAR